MSISIEIHPLSDSLQMYGRPDSSAAYSLSGHVSISLLSTSSLFERRRAVRLLLQSLHITFEGQAELVTPETGYSPLRLCSITRDLAPAERVELNNEGLEDSDKPCTWNVVFNLPIPGWLPATSKFGDSQHGPAGNCYSLHATAKFLVVDDGSQTAWFSSLCSPFRSKTRTIEANPCDIFLSRFAVPPARPSSSTSPFPTATYAIEARSDNVDLPSGSSVIPLEILSKIQILASVPELVDVESSKFPLCLRLRTRDLPESECKKLRVTDFSVDIEQYEKYRTIPPSEYMTQYPIPSQSSQPPFEPLLAPHSVSTLFDLGLVVGGPHSYVTRTFSLLPQNQSGRFQLSGDGSIFAEDANEGSSTNRWFCMETDVPFSQLGHGEDASDKDYSWAGAKKLRVTANTPLFLVRHKLHISLSCTYDLDEASAEAQETPKQISERVHFSIPLEFVQVQPATRVSPIPSGSRSHSPASSISSVSSVAPLISTQPSLPYASSLPAYSQLFHSNGDRKIDYSIPLPLYTPSPHTPSLSHLDEDEGDDEKTPLLTNAPVDPPAFDESL
ncbi:hypothetical protein JAAARDRAFT_31894 [Jaapia argillacea MUCL 33604]|uniref:Arrestin-like N-terminal domain-containing protein n=1 Tax=Jaapia argillacea MUCL 33604 TaxID=933084 RepID=A0A067QBK3_9AGAM|nr:hypothetical protein JAAARDRAFT_31894 [Jaapia argillacea MUCL 33604]